MPDPTRTSAVMCPHENFTADVTVNRLADLRPMGFAAEIQIRCARCGEPFAFVGPPVGVGGDGPYVSVAGTELRIPIRPGWEPREPIAMASVRLTIEPPRSRTDA